MGCSYAGAKEAPEWKGPGSGHLKILHSEQEWGWGVRLVLLGKGYEEQRSNSLNQREVQEGGRAKAKRVRAHSSRRVNIGGMQIGEPKPGSRKGTEVA